MRPVLAASAIIVIMLTVVVACGNNGAASQATPTPTALVIEPVTRMSRIAFASKRDGNWEIYVMNADGTDQHNVTNNPDFDSYPSWSPDGKRIAFYTERDGNREIYTMDSDGANQVRLTSNAYQDYSPEWSPDGKSIAFISDRSGETHIWLMNSDGSEPRNYSMVLKNSRYPTWSPDSKKLAYMWDRNINVMTPDGRTGETVLDRAKFFDGYFVGALSWSPDGAHLAMISNHLERNSASRVLYTSQLDGFRFRTVHEQGVNTAPQDRPTWSPDSSMITYGEQTPDGDWDIFVVNFLTAQVNRLTSNPEIDTFPDWEPVGTVPPYPAQ